MDLTETEDIKKTWQKHTAELYKTDLCGPDNHDGVITHLEPDILECEVKWALGSIIMNKASGGNGILVELFQITVPSDYKESACNAEDSGSLPGSGRSPGKGNGYLHQCS